MKHRCPRLLQRGAARGALLVLAACWLGIAPADAATEANGALLYRAHCAACHGSSGKGDGPNASIFAPPPRNLRSGFLDKYPNDELVRRVREGQPLDLTLDAAALRARAGETEAVLTHLKRLPAINWRFVAPGAETYAGRCVACHGPYGRAPSTLPAGVKQPRCLCDPAFQQSHSMDDLLVVVRHGREGMPALTPRITEEEAKPLAAFVRLISPGFELYASHCGGCHGEDGRGTNAPVGKIKLPAVAFDRAYFAKRDQEQLRAAVWHMLADKAQAMPHYRARLDDEQARSIIEFLKAK